jgi:hypothetical protein
VVKVAVATTEYVPRLLVQVADMQVTEVIPAAKLPAVAVCGGFVYSGMLRTPPVTVAGPLVPVVVMEEMSGVPPPHSEVHGTHLFVEILKQ